MSRLQIVQLTKILKGQTILDHIELELTGGATYGFVGRNGSGKTHAIPLDCRLDAAFSR